MISLSVCLSVHEHISETAGPIFEKFVVQIPRGHGSVLLCHRVPKNSHFVFWSQLSANKRRFSQFFHREIPHEILDSSVIAQL